MSTTVRRSLVGVNARRMVQASMRGSSRSVAFLGSNGVVTPTKRSTSLLPQSGQTASYSEKVPDRVRGIPQFLHGCVIDQAATARSLFAVISSSARSQSSRSWPSSRPRGLNWLPY